MIWKPIEYRLVTAVTIYNSILGWSHSLVSFFSIPHLYLCWHVENFLCIGPHKQPWSLAQPASEQVFAFSLKVPVCRRRYMTEVSLFLLLSILRMMSVYPQCRAVHYQMNYGQTFNCLLWYYEILLTVEMIVITIIRLYMAMPIYGSPVCHPCEDLMEHRHGGRRGPVLLYMQCYITRRIVISLHVNHAPPYHLSRCPRWIRQGGKLVQKCRPKTCSYIKLYREYGNVAWHRSHIPVWFWYNAWAGNRECPVITHKHSPWEGESMRIIIYQYVNKI